MYIKREIEEKWAAKGDQSAKVLIGPRQCGKSSLLMHLKPASARYVSFDDINFRDLAARDPKLFLDQLGDSLIIDEAQYAPSVFPEIKRRIDDHKTNLRAGRPSREALYWLTGSNRILMDREVSESLTGRASYFRLHTFSLWELREAGFLPSIEDMLFRGGWPELWINHDSSWLSYLNDHIDTTLIKDIVRTTSILKVAEFTRFLRLTAARIGGIYVASEVAKDAGVRSVTIHEWLSFVERMMYIYVIPAWATSLSTRLIKSPKVYFADTAIATRLQGWSTIEQVLVSPGIGFLFENIVLSEIIKTRDNHLRSWEISHYRTKERQEIDFIVHNASNTFAIECKLSSREAQSYDPPESARKIKILQHLVVSLDGGIDPPNAKHLSISQLRDFLLAHL
jgi:predicted AAA+ superfamily ATPase